MVRKKRYRGHYCWACGRVLANERFSGSGHARHVCRQCSAQQRRRRRAERTRLGAVLAEFTATNRDTRDGLPAACGWTVQDIDERRRRLRVQLIFVAGQDYCCFEPDCHLGLVTREAWRRLRELCAANALPLPAEAVELRLEGVVEAGARYRSAGVAEGYRYLEVFREGKGG